MTTASGRWVKICGITNLADAQACVAAGASAIGFNFVPSSRRFLEPRLARDIADAVRGHVELVGVFADESVEHLQALFSELGLDWLQLHGNEPPELVARLPRAYKAFRVGSFSDIERALGYPGQRVLLDALVEGELGGTGASFDWNLVPNGVDRARLVIAGGLTPENVATAVRVLSPFGVDVASGVELAGKPRLKIAEKILAFVRAARDPA